MYLILGVVKLKDAVTFAYKDGLTAGAGTGAYWKATKVAETYGQERHRVELRLLQMFQTWQTSSSLLRFQNSFHAFIRGFSFTVWILDLFPIGIRFRFVKNIWH